MHILLLLTLVSILIYVFKKPHYLLTAFGIVVSTSPIWKLGLAETELYIFYLTLLALAMYEVFFLKKKLRIVCLFAIIMIGFQIFVAFVIGSESIVLYLSLYQFVVIPIIVLCSMQLIQLKNESFTRVYFPYFVVNLTIFYIRAFIDYTFFGIALVYNFDKWGHVYSMGGIAYRPSNLNSPIIFSIELATYLGICLYERKFSKRNKILFLTSIIPLLFMRSRSAFVILIFGIIGYIAKNKTWKYTLPIAMVALLAFIVGGTIVGFNDAMSFGRESTIEFRLNSALQTLREFWKLEFLHILFGNGVGSANVLAEGESQFAFYSENYFVAKMVDTGIIGTMLYVGLITVALVKNKNISMTCLFIGFLAVNFLASSMTGYTVKLMFWVMIYSMLFNVFRMRRFEYAA